MECLLATRAKCALILSALHAPSTKTYAPVALLAMVCHLPALVFLAWILIAFNALLMPLFAPTVLLATDLLAPTLARPAQFPPAQTAPPIIQSA